MNSVPEPLLQVLLSLLYYVALLLLIRLSGKRLAGQTTTFDLLVLISLGVVLQTTALQKGTLNAIIFVVTVFAVHRSLAFACARWPKLRLVVRGAPRPLIRNGKVDRHALEQEGLSYAELLAGLRKLGIERPEDVKLAALEETGHVSAVPLRE